MAERKSESTEAAPETSPEASEASGGPIETIQGPASKKLSEADREMIGLETALSVVKKASYADLFLRLTDTGLLLSPDTFEVLAANDAAEKLFGLPLEQFHGQLLTRWIPPESRENFDKTLRIIRRRYHPRDFEMDFDVNSQRIPVRISGCVVKLNDDRETIQFIIKDIRQERETQAKIKSYIQELEQLNQKLEALSTTDEMTRLFNFRHFRGQLLQEHTRAKRYSGHYCLVFFDIDNFKHYNDHNGHPAGDELLREFAVIVQNSCRETDMAARYGGEEFVVLCPESDADGGLIVAERIRTAVEKRKFKHGEHQPLGKLTVSVGVSSFPEDGESPEEVLEAADQALYHSKKTGRNRTTMSRDRHPKSDLPKS